MSEEKPEVLFTLWANAGTQQVGSPTSPGSGRLKIEITPMQMIRLQQELSNRAIIALMFVLEHGSRGAGQRVEIEGWSARWLIERGMARTTAEKAARELADKGYIRSERMPGSTSPLGKKLGVVPPSAINLEAEDEVGILRTDGRPRLQKAAAGDTTDSAAPAEQRNGADPVDDESTTTVSAPRRNDVPAERRQGETEDVFPQVSALSAESLNNASPPPSSSGSEIEGLFFLPGQGQSLTRLDLTRFFAQEPLTTAISDHWDLVVALVAREFAPHATRCAELIEWLGESSDAHPETRLAQIVVDLMKVPSRERFPIARVQEAFLRTRGVKFRQTSPDDFLAAFVVTIVTSLDSARPIETWPGWFGAGLKRDTQFQAKVLSGVLAVFRGILEDPTTLTAPEGAVQKASETTYTSRDLGYEDRLREAAQGTIWEDEISFEMLLRNPGRQAQIIAAYEHRQAGGQ